MGDRNRYTEYFTGHCSVCYRWPGWVEFRTPDLELQPAFPEQKQPSADSLP